MKKLIIILIFFLTVNNNSIFSCHKKHGVSQSCGTTCCIFQPLQIFPKVNCDYINLEIISGTVRNIYNEQAFFFIWGLPSKDVDITVIPDESKPVKMTIQCLGSQFLFSGYEDIGLVSKNRLNCIGKFFLLLKYTKVDARQAPPGKYRLCHKIEVNYSEI